MSASEKSSNLDIYIGQSIGMVISLPSAILYFLECIAILWHWKQFNSSFYKLFLFSAFNNLFMNFLPSFFYARLIRIGWINEFYLVLAPKWLPNALCFIMYYNYHCENVATIFTLIHRLTVIVNPLHYERQWRLLLKFAVFSIFFCPILFTYRFMYWPLTSILNPDNSVELVINQTVPYDKPIITNFTMMLITSIGYLLINIVLNVLVYLAYKKKQTQFSLNNDKSSRLLVYAIAIFLAQLLLCLFWLLLTAQQFFKLFPSDFNQYLANQYVWMNDIRTVAFPAWFLLWASAELNERLRKMFPWFPLFRMIGKDNTINSSENKSAANRGATDGPRRVSMAPIRSISSSTNSPLPTASNNRLQLLSRARSAAVSPNYPGGIGTMMPHFGIVVPPSPNGNGTSRMS